MATSRNRSAGLVAVAVIGVLAAALLASLYFFNARIREEGSPANAMLMTEAGRLLGRSAVLLPAKPDMNGDGIAEAVFLTPVQPGLQASFERFGSLALMQTVKRKPRALLIVSPTGIVAGDGTVLVPQVAAKYGYRARLQGQSVVLLMLDEQGKPASDELVVEWSAAAQDFRIAGADQMP